VKKPHKARFKDFSGTLPPKRSGRNGNCLSAIWREFEESAERSEASFAVAA
jgi:hypothetical protein